MDLVAHECISLMAQFVYGVKSLMFIWPICQTLLNCYKMLLGAYGAHIALPHTPNKQITFL